MMYNTEDTQGIESPELIAMRTHLTVAMLAAAQLHRKTRHLPEAAHLQDYLDQSLKALVEDVGKVDALVTLTEACTAIAPAETVHRRMPRPLRWSITLLQRATHGFRGWIHRKQHARLTTLYLYR